MISGCDSMLDISLVEEFLSFGIDLTQLNLVFNESTNPGWGSQEGKLEPVSLLSAEVIKSEDQSDNFEEIIGLSNECPLSKNPHRTNKALRKNETVNGISRNSTERNTSKSRAVQITSNDSSIVKLNEIDDDQVNTDQNQVNTDQNCSEDPDFEVNPSGPKRKYTKRKKLEKEFENLQKTKNSE